MRARYLLPLPLLLLACTKAEVTPAPNKTANVATTTQPAGTTMPSDPKSPKPLPYPETRKQDIVDTLFGVKIPDPYRWLEDGKSNEVQAWMKAEDDLARAELQKLPERDAFAARLKELFYIDSISAPRHRGDRYFYSRRHADKEKAILYWKKGKNGEEKVLLDPNTWSTDGSVSLGGWKVSWDGKTIAYTVKKNAADEASLHILDVATGKVRDAEIIEGAKYAEASWTAKGDGFYYTWVPTDKTIPEADRPGYAEVRFHKLGDDPKNDVTVRERTKDPTTFIWCDASYDGHWVLLNVSHGWTSNDVYFKDARDPNATFQPLAVGKNAHFWVDFYKDHFFVLTDYESPHWRVAKVDPKNPKIEDWKTIVPERADASIDLDNGASIVGGRLAVAYLKNATSQLEIFDTDGKKLHDVALPGVGTFSGLVGHPEEEEAYFVYQSFTTPWEVHSLSMKSAKTGLYSKVKVPVDPSPYTVEQVFYPSKDGTRVSMFIVRRKDLQKNGDNKTLLYGYGGFQQTETSIFTASIYPWLERGGVYAVPNLRGGAEYGEEWHKNGMRDKKQNVFDDFIAAAEYLFKEGYTRPERLVISGGSNGGLLVGAAMTQKPEYYAAVLCSVPLLDMVRYHLFGSGKTWISEYGSAEHEDELKYLFAYSPYHHVKDNVRYPALLMLSADSDDRVDPLHARKFVAAVQERGIDNPALLRIEKNSGHGGADLIKAEVEKGADRYAFALYHVSKAPALPTK
ncbi:MAG: prolyl oligopeptidase family serine peptidase [Polyangiaceae bacterium]